MGRLARLRPDVGTRSLRTLTGTVLPLVLAYGAIVVLLVAARRPRDRTAIDRPIAALLSIAGGGYVVFAAVMGVYCGAQARNAIPCARDALLEGGALATATLALGLITVARARRN
jgi:hypothetical protein